MSKRSAFLFSLSWSQVLLRLSSRRRVLHRHGKPQPDAAVDLTGSTRSMGNSAAPYLNSLMTPGNPNAAMTSWASNYRTCRPAFIRPSRTTSGRKAEPGRAQRCRSLPEQHRQRAEFERAPPDQSRYRRLEVLPGGRRPSPEHWLGQSPGHQQPKRRRAPQSQWTVPTTSFSGTYAAYTNAYNGTNQYNYAVKHDGQLFFTATNGGTAKAPDTSPSNPEAEYYAPLQQLSTDLTNNTVADYNWITPDQYNDMHSSLKRTSPTRHAYTEKRSVGDRARRQLPVADRPDDRSLAGLQEQRRDRDLVRRDRGCRDAGRPPASPSPRSSSRRSPRATPTEQHSVYPFVRSQDARRTVRRRRAGPAAISGRRPARTT